MKRNNIKHLIISNIMSYYIIPKINNIIKIESNNNDISYPFISKSLYNQFIFLQFQVEHFIKKTSIKININELLDNYHLLFKNDNFNNQPRISTLTYSSIFYQFIEIHSNINIRNSLIGENIFIEDTNLAVDIKESLQFVSDVSFNFVINNYDSMNNYDYIIMNNNTHDNIAENYYNKLLFVEKHLNIDGILVFKINDLFHKVNIDLTYILSSMFERVIIFKPNTSSLENFEKFIICKGFSNNNPYLLKNKVFHDCHTFIKNDIPIYFLNKINDINIITGQKILDSYSIIINMLNNNIDDLKLSVLQKSNMEKCVSFCEKYKIPYNKVIDKMNIFLKY